MTIADAAVTAEQLAAISQDVWSSFLSLDLVEVADEELTGRTATGVVHVSGEWAGSVVVECSSEHAVAAAEAMFAADPGTLSPDEVSDALGELTNMVGGNVKSLLPAPSSLSIPSVVEGESCTVRVPGSVLVERVTLGSPVGPVRVTVWKV